MADFDSFDVDTDQQQVMGILEPYLDRMYPIFPGAMSTYQSKYSTAVRAEHEDRTAAGCVRDHAWAGFNQEFGDETGFNFLDIRGLSVLNIRDELVIRIKKVDENGRHRNYQTQQQKAFDNQEQLPGLPPAAVRVVLGYQPDIAFSEVERVIVRRPQGAWVSQINDPAVEKAAWTDITPVQLPIDVRWAQKK